MNTSDYSLEYLLSNDGFIDGCGKKHFSSVDEIIIRGGAIGELAEVVRRRGKSRPFLLADPNTWTAAGERAARLLEAAGFKVSSYILPDSRPEPDERTVGSAAMNYDYSCDIVVGVGSGVVNDTAKILAALTGNDYIIVGTAPSMDGFASATSSMSRAGLKVSLPSRGASVIIGDTDILAAAPAKMLASGVGDMAAKYVSLCEWKLANTIIGEYYCPNIAAIVRRALDEVAANAEGLARREPHAVEAVMRGLVLAGIAMNYAGVSRPASGIEHYFSHIWDMRGLEFNTPVDLHGIQCGVATLLSLKLYKYIRRIKPDRDKAIAYVSSFDKEKWFGELRSLLGRGAETMISAEAKDKKYDPAHHRERLDVIISKWDEIVAEIDRLPDYAEVERLLHTVGAPTSPEEIGQTGDIVRRSLPATKDIRDKYVASRLLWDLGELESAAKVL